ncbi:RICIN domain-containing protein [Streptomyces roseifaciens]|uniref:RICIN domain-containing protein n=1 Tax=Streptomyces roseifaciens TaxID=1488406 RepID=UPI0007180B1C|nr:RICIN domain-containing protein [Streptomyces roseifaciens]
MVVKPVPTQTPQLIVHSASGLHITPQGRADQDLEVRLWRSGWASAGDRTRQWIFLPVSGHEHTYRIKNAQFERYLTLEKPTAGTPVVFLKSNSTDQSLWKLIYPDSAQADFVIASALDTGLVVSPKEGAHEPEATLEVEELGPYTDQFWRTREPRS